MSLENAKRFMDVVSKDQALQQRFAALEPTKMVGLAVQAGSERGLSFTAEEFMAASVRVRTAVLSSTMIDSKASPVASGFLPVKPRRRRRLTGRLSGSPRFSLG